MSIISADDYEPPLQLVQPMSYTLAELEELARECAEEIQGGMVERLSMSLLLTWLKRREKEGER